MIFADYIILHYTQEFIIYRFVTCLTEMDCYFIGALTYFLSDYWFFFLFWLYIIPIF